ncbi:MAG: AAA family ATPase, partial [Polyangiaceae bacterium]|nr:AAA family ATPase [Polyangiaceae bacterium]
PLYKANRPPRDEAAVAQLTRVKEALAERGFKLMGCSGYEADDVIATLVEGLFDRFEITIAGSDKDLLQLVRPTVRFLSITVGLTLDEDGVRAKHGVSPSQIRDYLALIGDTADNVKGVPRCGPVHAARLLNAYGDIDRLLEAARAEPSDVGPPSIRRSLLENETLLRLAMRLVELERDVPIHIESVLGGNAAHDTEPTTNMETPMAMHAPTALTGATSSQPTEPTPRLTGRFGRVSSNPKKGPMKSIITGKPTVGKTYFLSTIPDCFYIPLEDGLRGRSPNHPLHCHTDAKDNAIIPSTLPEFYQALDSFARDINAPVNGRRPHRDLCIDGLTGLEKLVHAEACGAEKAGHMEDKEYKKVWSAAERLFMDAQERIDAVRRTGVRIWLSAHAAEVVNAAATSGQIYRTWDILLKGSHEVGVHARNLWRGWADNVLFIDWAIEIQKGSKGSRSVGKHRGRVMLTTDTGTHAAKHRDRLPPVLPATWEDLANALAAGSAAPATKFRAEIEKLVAKLDAEQAAAVMAELAKSTDANRLAALHSRVQGLVAIAEDALSDDGDAPSEEDATANAAE